MQKSFYIQGTPKQLVENGLTVNGKPVSQQMISVLVRLGACEEVGTEDRPEGAKGPAAKVYRFYGKKAFKFAVDKEQSERVKRESMQAEQAAKQDQSKQASSVPTLPAALQSLSEEDLQAAIKALQALQSMQHAVAV